MGAARILRSWTIGVAAIVVATLPYAQSPAERFTCCNLRHQDGWMSDHQLTTAPFVPAGSRTKILDWGNARVYVQIEGRKFGAGSDHRQPLISRERLAKLWFVEEDPAAKLESYPPDVRAAIRSGRVMLGMRKEQVLMSLGHPRFDATPDVAASNWIYFATEDGEFDLDWSDDGTLRAIHAPSRVRRLVLFTP